jgi:hypothetical protein
MFNIIAQLEFIQFDKKLLGKIFPYYIEFEYSHSLFVTLLVGILSIFLFLFVRKFKNIQTQRCLLNQKIIKSTKPILHWCYSLVC